MLRWGAKYAECFVSYLLMGCSVRSLPENMLNSTAATDQFGIAKSRERFQAQPKWEIPVYMVPCP